MISRELAGRVGTPKRNNRRPPIVEEEPPMRNRTPLVSKSFVSASSLLPRDGFGLASSSVPSSKFFVVRFLSTCSDRFVFNSAGFELVKIENHQEGIDDADAIDHKFYLSKKERKVSKYYFSVFLILICWYEHQDLPGILFRSRVETFNS
jgi:hypothetical protein